MIVSWNVREHVVKCLESVLASAERSGVGLETVVVDNASSDGTAEEISERFPSVELIANDENVGLARAVSQVAGSSQSDYLFLLNPDTWLEDGALGRLVDALDRFPAVGVVGPAIVADDGRAEQPCRRFPPAARLFLGEHASGAVLAGFAVGTALSLRRFAGGPGAISRLDHRRRPDVTPVGDRR